MLALGARLPARTSKIFTIKEPLQCGIFVAAQQIWQPRSGCADWNGEKRWKEIVTCCHSAVCILAEGLDLCHSHHNWHLDP